MTAFKRTIFLSLLFAGIIFAASNGEADEGRSLTAGVAEEAVFRKVTEDGLVILTKKGPARDIVSVCVRIKAGSSLEGEYVGSGIAHFVEHMVFKGTRTRKAGEIEREMKSYGGFINGSVSCDLTTFYLTVPSKYLRQAVSLLRDMLMNATFDETEFAKEQEVILSEIRLNKDDPETCLMRYLYETAYIAHPYRYPVIGYEERFKNLSREDLLVYYRRMYTPHRTVVAIVGGIEGEKVAAAIVENEFHAFKSLQYTIDPCVSEPPQTAVRRRDEVTNTASAYLAMAVHSTSVFEEDLFAMDVLAMILGQFDNSRLNVNLLKKMRLVHRVSSWNYTPRDPGLFVIQAMLDREKMAAAEEAVKEELKRVGEGGPENEELDTAKRLVLSNFLQSRETTSEQAFDISAGEALTSDYDFSRRYVEGISKVSRDDIKRVFARYLAKGKMTIVRLLPAGYEVSAGNKKAEIDFEGDAIKKDTLPNGLRILLRRNEAIPMVSICAAIGGGLSAEDRTTNGISHLAASMLLKGTVSRKEGEIRGGLERRGGGIAPFSGYDSYGLNIAVLKEDVDYGLELLKDIVANSTFPQEEIDKEKEEILARIKEADDDMFEKGAHLVMKELFGDHPYGLRGIGDAESVRSLTREALIDYHATRRVPGNMVVSVSGDIDEASAARKLTGLFEDVGMGSAAPHDTGAAPAGRKRCVVEMDKEQSLILIAFRTTDIKDHDRFVLDLVGSIMSGQSGRLFNELRNRRSFGYTLGCVQRMGLKGGSILFYIATSKKKLPAAEKALFDEISRLKTATVTDEELTMAREELKTQHAAKLETNSFVAMQASLDELRGLGFDEIYQYRRELDKVTKDDIKRAALKYLDSDKCATVVISGLLNTRSS